MLLALPHIAFVSLQRGAREDEYGLTVPLPPDADFADTASLVAALDHVVSIDSSVAHLAGAMGVAVSLLLPAAPDWRWLLYRDDSPWYSGHRLHRQNPPGDWASVLADVADELAARYPGRVPAYAANSLSTSAGAMRTVFS